MISAGLAMGKTIPPLRGCSSGYLEGSSIWLPMLVSNTTGLAYGMKRHMTGGRKKCDLRPIYLARPVVRNDTLV